MATKTRPPLGAEETRIVLRRAAELDREHAPPLRATIADEPRLDAGDLERIAAESGLSRESLRRAVDELTGGVLHNEVSGESLLADELAEVREQLGMFAEDLDEDAAALDRMEAAGMDKGTDAPA